MFYVGKKIIIALVIGSILFPTLVSASQKNNREERILKEEGTLTLKDNPWMHAFLDPLKDEQQIAKNQIPKKLLKHFLFLHKYEEENHFTYHDRKGVLGYKFVFIGENGQRVWEKLIWVNWSAK